MSRSSLGRGTPQYKYSNGSQTAIIVTADDFMAGNYNELIQHLQKNEHIVAVEVRLDRTKEQINLMDILTLKNFPPSVTTCGLQDCKIGDDNAILLSALRLNITNLDLHDNAISDKGAVALANSSRLKTLVLTGNNDITDKGVSAFLSNKTLHALTIDNENISKNLLTAIKARIDKNKRQGNQQSEEKSISSIDRGHISSISNYMEQKLIAEYLRLSQKTVSKQGDSKVQTSVNDVEKRKDFVLNLLTHILNKKVEPAKEWCDSLHDFLDAQIKNSTGKKDHPWYMKLGKIVGNAFMAFPIFGGIKYAITGTYFFSLRGKSEELAKDFQDLVKPAAPGKKL